MSLSGRRQVCAWWKPWWGGSSWQQLKTQQGDLMVIGHLCGLRRIGWCYSSCSGRDWGGFLMGRTWCAGEWAEREEKVNMQWLRSLIITTLSYTDACRGAHIQGVFLCTFSCVLWQICFCSGNYSKVKWSKIAWGHQSQGKGDTKGQTATDWLMERWERRNSRQKRVNLITWEYTGKERFTVAF